MTVCDQTSVIVDEQAEEALLSAMLGNDHACIVALEEVEAEDFWLESRRCVFRTIQDLHARGIGIDRVTVRNALPRSEETGLRDYVSHLGDRSYVAAHTRDYCRVLREMSARRRARCAAEALANEASDGGGDAEAVLAAVERVAAEAANEIRERIARVSPHGASTPPPRSPPQRRSNSRP